MNEERNEAAEYVQARISELRDAIAVLQPITKAECSVDGVAQEIIQSRIDLVTRSIEDLNGNSDSPNSAGKFMAGAVKLLRFLAVEDDFSMEADERAATLVAVKIIERNASALQMMRPAGPAALSAACGPSEVQACGDCASAVLSLTGQG